MFLLDFRQKTVNKIGMLHLHYVIVYCIIIHIVNGSWFVEQHCFVSTLSDIGWKSASYCSIQ